MAARDSARYGGVYKKIEERTFFTQLFDLCSPKDAYGKLLACISLHAPLCVVYYRQNIFEMYIKKSIFYILYMPFQKSMYK